MTAPTAPTAVQPTCSAAGCTAVAVLSWQRSGTDAEAQAAADAAYAVQLAYAEQQRSWHLLAVAELTARRAAAAELPGVTPQILAVIDSSIADEQAAADAITDPAKHAAVDPITKPMFGCATHAVDAEVAAGLHDVGCAPGSDPTASPDTCGCTPVMPTPDPEPPT